MSYTPTVRANWPLQRTLDCPAHGFVDCVDHKFSRLRRVVLALFVAILAIGGIASVLNESSLAFQGDDLTYYERANVMTARDIANAILTGDDEGFIEFVAPNARIAYPGGSVYGPEGAATLSEILDGNGDYRPFSVWEDDVIGSQVTLNWRLGGPINPGSLIWYSVPAGSAIGGQMVRTLVNGQVVDARIIVTS